MCKTNQSDKTAANDTAKAIRDLNDLFRQTLGLAPGSSVKLSPQFLKACGISARGRVFITSGVAHLSEAEQAEILRKVQTFNAFTKDNDPYREHDFGAFDNRGEKIFWKIDYYNATFDGGSEDPADPAKTARVLTIMLASEY